MLWLISYDVVDDRRRRRVMEALKDYGRRVQYSVYECGLDPEGLEELWGRLKAEVDEREDSVRGYALCARCEGAVKIAGKGDRYEEPGFIVV